MAAQGSGTVFLVEVEESRTTPETQDDRAGRGLGLGAPNDFLFLALLQVQSATDYSGH